MASYDPHGYLQSAVNFLVNLEIEVGPEDDLPSRLVRIWNSIDWKKRSSVSSDMWAFISQHGVSERRAAAELFIAREFINRGLAE